MSKNVVIEDEKKRVRSEATSLRDALPFETRRAASETLAVQDFPFEIAPGMVVSGFMPMRSEINPLPLMRKLLDAGATLALPVIAGRGKPLIMRVWQWGEPLSPGLWGIREPKPEAPEVEPDILLVPLLAFDRTGHRIGYGAGYYDKTIGQLRGRKAIAAIGLAFAMQEISAVPATGRDARLDLVLTEREVISFRA